MASEREDQMSGVLADRMALVTAAGVGIVRAICDNSSAPRASYF
jgi:hypothetical protein